MHTPGDIVVLPFPHSDRLAEKRRPALVVSSMRFNRETGLVWLVMITSSAARKMPGDIRIEALSGTGLPVPSIVRPAKIACVEQERILRTAGHLDGDMTRQVRAHIAGWLTDQSA